MSDRHLLLVGPSWIGDMVMAQSLFQTLRRRWPGCKIDVLAPGWSELLLARMPEVNTALTMPLGHGQLGLAERYRLARRLREQRYDQAIVLPNSWKSALVPYWADIPLRTGYRGELRWGLLNDMRRLDKQQLPLTVQRFVALGLPADSPLPPSIPPPKLILDSQTNSLERLELEAPTGPLLALCPGAEYGPAKRWPAEHFAAVASDKLDQGWQVWLFGSAKDQPQAATINRLLNGRCIDLCGRTSLAEVVDLLALADIVVSNDSGLMHIAAALQRPLIAVYGSTDPGHTPPLGEHARILHLKLECSPCFRRKCPLGHLRCLRELEPQSVLDAMAEFG